MSIPQLPPGLTPGMLEQLAKFFAAQPVVTVRPSGLLKVDQVRGRNPNYQYVFHEFPKMLTPPSVRVMNAGDEKRLRSQWKTPLPWDGPGALDAVADYYDTQSYPKIMTPPQVVVYSADEERAKRSAWRAEGGDDYVEDAYPKWLFHPTQKPQFVTTREQEISMGKGWFATPAEAQEAAERLGSSEGVEPAINKAALLAEANRLGIVCNNSWGIPRLTKAIEDAKAEQKEPEPA